MNLRDYLDLVQAFLPWKQQAWQEDAGKYGILPYEIKDKKEPGIAAGLSLFGL
ncbi:MAG: hypothetical protein KKB70_10625 [Proteobacteria bacterium]|nr:hypothetical protein [Pseudomonadota bacterium]MBU1610955.1 hypothetical protein [Pseudomonadota bacterium]